MKNVMARTIVGMLAASFIVHAADTATKPRVRLETTKGPIVLELNPQAAPKTVENFLQYVKDGFYNGTVFHRVIKGFMIQGGGMTSNLSEKATRPPVANEADNRLKNEIGTIAMARTNDPHSASSQFFINTNNNVALNFRSKDEQGYGYCVFGKVVGGMNTVRAIESVETGDRGMFQNVPIEAVVITKTSIVESEPVKSVAKDSAEKKTK
jgi:peptidyl-prolyl cis-trans isomerase B (cyclophilin B)